MSKELLTMSAQALKAAYQTGALSPVEVCSSLLDHIEKHDQALNAWCLIDRDTTLQWARDSEQRYQDGKADGLLDGIPVAVKDGPPPKPALAFNWAEAKPTSRRCSLTNSWPSVTTPTAMV